MSEVVYVGKDLEAMTFAVNYHRWILDEFRPFLGTNIVEVGAGTGAFSTLLLGESPETLSLVEPSEMFGELQKTVSQIKTAGQIFFYEAVFEQICGKIAERQKPDSIIYVNVLEHIEDDLAELKLIYETLQDGGRLFIFVPALQILFGAFDAEIGHFRRYTKKALEEKCRTAGFKIVSSKYMDLAGIVPWFIKYRILRSKSLDSGSVKLYDKIAVPVISKFEKLLTIPVGRNCLVIAEK